VRGLRPSKIAFGVEALLLAYPTLIGIMMVGGAVLPVITGAHASRDYGDAVMGLTILAGLISGWRLAFGFLAYDTPQFRGIQRGWWYVATLLTLVSVVAFAALWLSADFGAAVAPLGYGILFVPSYLHLSAEIWFRKAQ